MAASSETLLTLVESPRHQTTCRRVRDCCAQLHNITQTWSSLSSQSFDILSRLMNTLTREEYVESSNDQLLKDHQDSNEVKIRLKGKMIEKREQLYSQLQQMVSQMSSSIQKLGAVVKNLQTSLQLLVHQEVDETPLFSTLAITIYAQYSNDIYQSYCEEQHLCESILGDVFNEKNSKDTQTVYLSCWLHQPCISRETITKLETLLVDSGLRDTT